jgi:hypothetical protein
MATVVDPTLTPAPASPATPATAATATTAQIDAIANLSKTFELYGLGTLAASITNFIYQGYSTDTVALLLQDTPEYKQRFAANDARRKAGLPVLSPAEYLATEESYRQIMQSAGLPKGFYDSPTDFQKFLEGDVAPTELKARVDAAAKAVDNSDPYYTQSLREMYGLSSGDMIAHLLDPAVAAPLVEKQSKAAEYGAAALRQGLAINTKNFEQYAGGIGTGIGAEQGMQQVAEITPGLSNLATISGTNYNQSTAESEVFGGLASAKRKRDQLVAQEEGRFTGRSNVDSKSLQGGTTGQF